MLVDLPPTSTQAHKKPVSYVGYVVGRIGGLLMAHLKQRQIDSLIKAGKAGSHSDGGGLILRLNGKGAANWLHRYQMNGKRRDMGLGSYPTVSLADARAKVAEARKLIADGSPESVSGSQWCDV